MTTALRSLLLAVPLSLALATAAGAQDQATPDMAAPADSGQAHAHADPAQQLARLTRRLQLSPAQAAQIGPILQDRLRQSSALRDDSSLAGPDRRAKLRDIMQSHDSQIAAILSDSQRQQFTQMRQQMAQHRDQAQPADGG
jgi:Skp family chaperone for outer membrane proteins